MEASSNDITQMGRGWVACAIGLGISIGVPGLFPGVVMMCIMVYMMEL
jgi:hypothetical protein